MYYWNKNKHSIVHYSDATVKSIEDYMARRAEKPSSDLSHLDDCLKKLSAGDVQLIQTRYSRKMTIKRMAEELGRSVQGLYSTLSRIHLMLAECIQRQRLVQER
jgi:DNA-directed RNA polymerase specialized sigma24 family protein